MADRKLAGQVERVQLRRIGYRHAVYTPQRTSQLLDANKLRGQLEKQNQQIEGAERQLEQMRALAAETAALLAAFDAQSVDRLDGDPEVPLEEPKQVAPVAPLPVEVAPSRRPR